MNTTAIKDTENLPEMYYGLPETLQYTMGNADEVKTVAGEFDTCPEEYKTQLARAILERAEEYNVVIDNKEIMRYAAK